MPDIEYKFSPGQVVRVVVDNKPPFFGVVMYTKDYRNPGTNLKEPLYSVRAVLDARGTPLTVPSVRSSWSLGEHRMTPVVRDYLPRISRRQFSAWELTKLPPDVVTKMGS